MSNSSLLTKSGHILDPGTSCDLEWQQRCIEIIIIKSTSVLTPRSLFNWEKRNLTFPKSLNRSLKMSADH